VRVSDSRRVLFVHVPKAGGSSVDRIFDTEVPDARKVPGRQRHAPYNRILLAEPEEEIPPLGLVSLGPAVPAPYRVPFGTGDQILLYTDGVVEARDANGVEFGLDRFTDFIIRSSAAGQRPAEVLRLLIHALLDHQRHRLRDDASILLFEWHPL